MKKIFLVLMPIVLSLSLASIAEAIQVKVKSTSKVTGLGFTVNGEKFGGMGRSYVKKDAPAGTYKFGVRTKRDIGCKTEDGEEEVNLEKNTTAILKLQGKKCLLTLSENK